jgi:hypothetical protein
MLQHLRSRFSTTVRAVYTLWMQPVFTRRFLLKYADGRLVRPRQLKLHDCLHSELHDYCHLKTLNYRDGNFRCFDFVNFACVLVYSGIQEGS